MNLNLADYIILFLTTLNLIVNICNHGKPKENYNGISAFIAYIIVLILYYQAGLFS